MSSGKPNSLMRLSKSLMFTTSKAELKSKDAINAGLHREMATSNALDDLTNALKRRRTDDP